MNFGELILNEPLVKCFASTTPETDSETNYCDAIPDMPWVDVDVARRLERERDEAREELAEAKREAENLAKSIYRSEYSDNDTGWELLESVAGVISQIDNFYAGVREQRDEARELAEAYKEYAQLLGAEINDMVIHAHVHGLKFSRFEQGKVLHEKIKQLEKKK